MSSVSLPVHRPIGAALVVGSPASRGAAVAALHQLGYGCAEADDPYTAMAELCRQPQAFQSIIVSLAGVYREELSLISAVKQRFPQVEVWLADIEGRQAALAEAMRLGADGLLGDEGLHRVALASAGTNGAVRPAPPASVSQPDAAPTQVAAAPVARSGNGASGSTAPRPPAPAQARTPARSAPQPPPADADDLDDLGGMGDTVLTAEELRALLQEQPSMPSFGPED